MRRFCSTFPAFVIFGLLVAEPPTLGGADCNRNGVDDLVDISSGTSRDCNSNAVPDECDLDGSLPVFELPVEGATLGRPGDIELADLDSDGDLDIVTEDLEILINRGDGTFEESTRILGEPVYTDEVKALDVDGDGILDLVARDWLDDGGGRILVLRGKGGAAFADPVAYDVGRTPRYLVTGDLTGDEAPDLLVTTESGSRLSVLVNDGSGSFTLVVSEVPTESHDPCIADFDGDGKMDVALARLGTREDPGSSVSVHFGDGQGGFSRSASLPAGDRPLRCAAADLDSDGDADLVVVNVTSQDVSVFANEGDGTFAPLGRYPVGPGPEFLRVADMDSDGVLDIVTTGPNIDVASAGPDTDYTSVLVGRGDGTFEPQRMVKVDAALGDPFDLELADLDGDGDLEILTANQFGGVAMVIPNLGGGTFADPLYLPVRRTGAGGGPIEIEAGDLDGDGDLDLVIGFASDRHVTVLRNVTAQSIASGCVKFVRGDVNSDGTVSLADMIMLRRWMYGHDGPVPSAFPCADAADVVDDERIDICDVSQILRLILMNADWASAMPPPFPEPGLDPTPDPQPMRGSCQDPPEDPDEGTSLPPIGCGSYEVTPPQLTDDLLWLGDASAGPGEEALVPVYLQSGVPVEATQLVFRYDPALLEIESGAESLDYSGSYYEQFFGKFFTFTYNEGHSTSSFTYGDRPDVSFMTAYSEEGLAVVGISGSWFFDGFAVPPGEAVLLASIRVRVADTVSKVSDVELTPVGGEDPAGLGPFQLRTEITSRGEARYVSTLPAVGGAVLRIVGDQSFFRGDSDGDESVTLTDAVYSLNALFLEGRGLSCGDAADANDDGELNIADPIYTLVYLFLGGPPPPPPFPEKGEDPTDDDPLGCLRASR